MLIVNPKAPGAAGVTESTSEVAPAEFTVAAG
jgi:hypothetical protein